MFSSVPAGSGTSSSSSTTRATKRAAVVEVEAVGRGGSPSRARRTAARRRSPAGRARSPSSAAATVPGVGDVVAEVGAVVDAGDDELGLEALDRPSVGEAHAVDRRAVGRVADGPVAEVDLLDPQRPARRDPAADRRAVAVGRDRPPARSPATSSSARRSACRPSASMPSSLVSRTRMVSGSRDAQAPSSEPGRAPARAGAPSGPPPRAAGPPAARRRTSSVAPPARDLEHRAHEHAVHVAQERVGLDPELEDVAALVPARRRGHVALEAHVVGLASA